MHSWTCWSAECSPSGAAPTGPSSPAPERSWGRARDGRQRRPGGGPGGSARAGVTVSLEESSIAPTEFDNPLASATSPRRPGARGRRRARSASISGRVEHDCRHHALFREGFALGDRPFALWRAVPPSGSGLNNAFRQILCGQAVTAGSTHTGGGARLRTPSSPCSPPSRWVWRPLAAPRSPGPSCARPTMPSGSRAGWPHGGRRAAPRARHAGGTGRAHLPGRRGARARHQRHDHPHRGRGAHRREGRGDQAGGSTRGDPLLDDRAGTGGRGVLGSTRRTTCTSCWTSWRCSRGPTTAMTAPAP